MRYFWHKPRWSSIILAVLAIFVMVLVFLLYLHPDFIVKLEALQSFCV